MIERLKSKDLGKKFAFYGPQDIIDQAIRVGIARNPKTFEHLLHKENLGRWTLIITPDSVLWQVQIIKDGIPKYYAVIDNELSCLITDFKFDDYKGLDSLFSGLDIYKGVNFTVGALRRESRQKSFASQVLAGSEWDDLRPARPIDFIGRDREIARITTMISESHNPQASTKIFGVSAPSGWGKSSLLLKLCDVINSDIEGAYGISVDCRSATSSNFISEAIHLAFKLAKESEKISIDNDFVITDASNPLNSEGIGKILEKMEKNKESITICFDQFEEIFAKEELLDTFEVITRLSYYIDANQLPIIIGVAWKTDISLPQNHPAYHMWHSLSDRRTNIRLSPFEKDETVYMIRRAQRGRT